MLSQQRCFSDSWAEEGGGKHADDMFVISAQGDVGPAGPPGLPGSVVSVRAFLGEGLQAPGLMGLRFCKSLCL